MEELPQEFTSVELHNEAAQQAYKAGKEDGFYTGFSIGCVVVFVLFLLAYLNTLLNSL